MQTADFVRDGIRNLLRYKLRSALTILGVVFGIAAVIAMLGIGAGAQATVLRQISGLGLRNIIIESVVPTTRAGKTSESRRTRLNYGVTFRDVDQLAAALPGANLEMVHIPKAKLYHGSQRINGNAYGVTSQYFDMMQARLVQGQNLGPAHNKKQMNVAVINTRMLEVAPQLRQGIGEVLRVGSKYFSIIGVVEIPAHESEANIYVPYHTAFNQFGTVQVGHDAGSFSYSSTEVGQLVLQATSENSVSSSLAVVEEVFKKNHRQDDYKISVPLHILKGKQATQRILNLVLITIAAISLVVGGIGIMNIMLASVTERIPEIGIRRAIGATRQDILKQFLVETATLTFMGGVIGCILGVLMVPFAAHWTGWPGIISWSSVVVSLSVSVVVGVVFGMAPAIRAARMDPGSALRHEI